MYALRMYYVCVAKRWLCVRVYKYQVYALLLCAHHLIYIGVMCAAPGDCDEVSGHLSRIFPVAWPSSPCAASRNYPRTYTLMHTYARNHAIHVRPCLRAYKRTTALTIVHPPLVLCHTTTRAHAHERTST